MIATGSSTKIPPFKGLAETGYLTHVEALALQCLPASLLVFGAGFLALEFAQIFSRMGTRVTLVARAPGILRIQEKEISEALRRYLEEEGIEIVTEATVQQITGSSDGKRTTVATPAGERRLVSEEILVATGVRGNIDGLGLERVGITTEDGDRIAVNEQLQTSVSHIYAAGDVTGRKQLETVAAKEGKIAVENAFANAGKTLDFSSIPYAVFTDPEVASVGMTETVQRGDKDRCPGFPPGHLDNELLCGINV